MIHHLKGMSTILTNDYDNIKMKITLQEYRTTKMSCLSDCSSLTQALHLNQCSLYFFVYETSLNVV